MYQWIFTARDNGGKYQCFKVKAATKAGAIDKGMKKSPEKRRRGYYKLGL